MKRFYFVRHGESDSNVGGILAGASTPLTTKGYEQARFIAARATKLPIEVIISSPMLRAHETARCIAEATGKDIELSELFVERKHPTEQFGKGSNDPEAVKIEDVVLEHFGEEGYRYSDEENFDDLKGRALKAMKFLENRPENHILIASHAFFLRIFVGTVFFGKDLSGYEANRMVRTLKTQNTALTIFDYDVEDKRSHWRIFTLNDHAHLG